MASKSPDSGNRGSLSAATITLITFLAIGVFFLIPEQRAHGLGWLFWRLLAACPLVHLVMHGRRNPLNGVRARLE